MAAGERLTKLAPLMQVVLTAGLFEMHRGTEGGLLPPIG